MRLTERGRKVGPVETVDEVEAKDRAIAVTQSAGRDPHEVRGRLGNEIVVFAHVDLGRVLDGNLPGPLLQPAEAVVPSDREHPRPQALGVAEL